MADQAPINPLPVDVVPSGFSNSNDAVNLLFMILNFLATIAIPLLIWIYGRRQEKAKQQQEAKEQQAKQQQEAKQRLQVHVEKLSDTDAMHIISAFKQDCIDLQSKQDCMDLQFRYAKVFREGRAVGDTTPGINGDIAITRKQIQDVDAARKRLQGIWDNIVDDYRADQLGGAIYSKQHRRMLQRGLTYMELVEPLEAANWVRLGIANSRMAKQGPYVLSTTWQPADDVTINMTNSALSQGPSPVCGSPSPAANGQTAPGTVASASSSAAACSAAQYGVPLFLEGARSSRFRWLENQKTFQLIGMSFWQEKPRQFQDTTGVLKHEVSARQHNPVAYQQLTTTPDGRAWLESMKAHWQDVIGAVAAATPADTDTYPNIISQD